MIGDQYIRYEVTQNHAGIEIYQRTWTVIKESPCFVWGVEFFSNYDKNILENIESGWKLKDLPNHGVHPVKRINKNNSRFAFKDKKAAYQDFIFRKTREAGHLNRRLNLIRRLLELTKEAETIDDLETINQLQMGGILNSTITLANSQDFAVIEI